MSSNLQTWSALVCYIFILSLAGCETNPAVYQKQWSEAAIGQGETKFITDWSGQEICIELTMSEPIFGDLKKPEVSLLLKNNNGAQAGRIGLMDTSRKIGSSTLYYEQDSDPGNLEKLDFIPYRLMQGAVIKLSLKDGKTLNISTRYSDHIFTLPFVIDKLEFEAISATGAYRYKLDC